MPIRVASPCHVATCPNRKPCPVHVAHRPAPSQRGYTKAWYSLSKTMIAEEPWCHRCMATHSENNPLTADHIVPLAKGGESNRENTMVLCRRCNSRKGANGR